MNKYIVVYCDMDGKYKAQIGIKGLPDKYGKPKIFKTKKEANEFIKRKTYGGMSHYYEIEKI